MSHQDEPPVFRITSYLHRKCMRTHNTLGQLRECNGSFAHEGQDYVQISVEVAHPWPQDRTF